MKTLITICILFLTSLFVTAQVNPNNHYVKGYQKSNGTYVQGYYRTNPNSTINDNYSTHPNVNPYTGKTGTVKPDYSTPTYTTPTYKTPSYSTPTYTTPNIYSPY